MGGKYSKISSQETAWQLLDEHSHNIERWFGAKAGADETNAMDAVLDPFSIDSANQAFGTALCIVGSGDTPFEPNMTHFHLSQILIEDFERATPYLLRLVWGASYAAGVAAGQYTEQIVFQDNVLYEIKLPRLAVGTKVFAACWVANNTGTLDFFIGIHESANTEV